MLTYIISVEIIYFQIICDKEKTDAIQSKSFHPNVNAIITFWWCNYEFKKIIENDMINFPKA